MFEKHIKQKSIFETEVRGRTVKLPYLYQRAAKKDSPLLLWLHGWSGGTAESVPIKKNCICIDCQRNNTVDIKNWNILFPLDTFGWRHMGCWWLGEHKDFFMLETIEELVKKEMKESNASELNLFGSSMGGFGALIHGINLGAKNIAVNVPQVNLMGNEYYELHKEKIDFIFDGEPSKYSNAANFINDKCKDTFFYMVQSRFDLYPNYLRDHSLEFINKLTEYGINYDFRVLPITGHAHFFTAYNAINYFDNKEKKLDQETYLQW